MQMGKVLWSISVAGIVGVLLWTGPAGAQPFPGGLPACRASLQRCQGDLESCQTELATCATFPGDGVDGPALSYTDNGETFTDNNTLLEWEKKVPGGGGSDTCLTDLHGVDSFCTWTQATGVWIAAINMSNLGGHSDWRVANVKELQSIVDYSKGNLASSVPGVTAADGYWSSTARPVGGPSTAWSVSFGFGGVFVAGKGSAARVRAVRGGR
jgi:Protein of unknown function (DUF1566)